VIDDFEAIYLLGETGEAQAITLPDEDPAFANFAPRRSKDQSRSPVDLQQN
jgi:hypothetical protein